MLWHRPPSTRCGPRESVDVVHSQTPCRPICRLLPDFLQTSCLCDISCAQPFHDESRKDLQSIHCNTLGVAALGQLPSFCGNVCLFSPQTAMLLCTFQNIASILLPLCFCAPGPLPLVSLQPTDPHVVLQIRLFFWLSLRLFFAFSLNFCLLFPSRSFLSSLVHCSAQHWLPPASEVVFRHELYFQRCDLDELVLAMPFFFISVIFCLRSLLSSE